MDQWTLRYCVLIWFNRMQKVNQGEPDFDLNLSVDDVATLVLHGAPGLGEAARERHAADHNAKLMK